MSALLQLHPLIAATLETRDVKTRGRRVTHPALVLLDGVTSTDRLQVGLRKLCELLPANARRSRRCSVRDRSVSELRGREHRRTWS